MKDWRKQAPPYEGTLVRLLLKRGLRLWYSTGPAGSADELLRRQQRALGAEMTVVYLTDAMTQDQDGKASILVNQKNGRKILCIDRDAADRALTMGLHESVPHLAAWQYPTTEDLEEALIRSDGFTQEMFGEPVLIRRSGLTGRLTAVRWFWEAFWACGFFTGFSRKCRRMRSSLPTRPSAAPSGRRLAAAC